MLYFVGVGGAGSRIVDSFYQKNVVRRIIDRLQSRSQWEFSGVVADSSDGLKALSHVPAENILLIGKSRVKGHGSGVDIGLGRKIVKEELGLVMNKISGMVSEKPWLVIMVAGLGGGTGTGGVPLIARKVKDVYKCKTLGVFVLPSLGEGMVYSKNALQALEEVLSSVDGSILLDNNVATDKGEDVLSAQKLVNNQILGFFRMVDEGFLERFMDNTSTIAYYKPESTHLSVKDAVEKMMRDDLYLRFNVEKAEKIVFIARGNLDYLYGHDFAQGWAESRFGAELEYEFYDITGSKGIELGILIAGTKDLNGRFDEIGRVDGNKKPSELDELLKDIHSIF